MIPKTTRMTIIAGSHDPVAPASLSRAYFAPLENLGGKAQLRIVDGGDEILDHPWVTDAIQSGIGRIERGQRSY